MKVYVAGKWEDKPRVQVIQECLKELGHTITVDWTRHKNLPTLKERPIRALEDWKGVQDCEILIIILVDNYTYRGTLVELGVALEGRKEIHLVGTAGDPCIFTHLPEIKKHRTTLDFLEEAKKWK